MADANNILYLLNHKTLTDFEVPIINKRGFGIFIPKIFTSLAAGNSINFATVNFYDNFVHISPDDLITLNQLNWFDNKHVLPHRVMEIINANFKYIFITLLTEGALLRQLIEKFEGVIYYRFFGLDSDKSYVPVVKRYASPKVKYIFSYPEILQFEKRLGAFFNDNNSCAIPLGLSNALIAKLRNTYAPENKAIAFICSRIDPKGCPYYFKIYQNFINAFQDYEYIIFGKNNGAVSANKNIRNNLPDNGYYTSISRCMCMYYHGKEPRHLHYHPLEAIIMGIPIIFHQESLLSSYLPNSPGRCQSMIEIKDRINRIKQNDSDLIKRILDEQKTGYQRLIQSSNTDIFDKILLE